MLNIEAFPSSPCNWFVIHPGLVHGFSGVCEHTKVCPSWHRQGGKVQLWYVGPVYNRIWVVEKLHLGLPPNYNCLSAQMVLG